RAFVTGLLENRYLPIDVYDTAAWMAITPLSEESIKNGSAPVEIPDFTHGMYKNRTERNGGIYDLS
ncbi:gfo/Idh/MocA family oxidoreductase, partial [Klebsiella pneumoniae]|nr:gfo/Idh/MocA family oxidoreductase [Klebsiella pneumoniae]